MNSRRDFLRAGLVLGAAAVLPRDAAAAEPAAAPAGATPPPAPDAKPVLVAVRDGERVAMLDRALETLGGIGAFVRPGQTVLIKPNIGWNAPPERGANTHPSLIGHLTKLCLAAGAKSVTVFDNTCDPWQQTYAISGIGPAVEAAGGRLVNGKDQSLYRETPIPRGLKLQSAAIHGLYLDSDVVLNFPVLKHHQSTLMTAAMKNLMGVVWDRGFYHRSDLHQCIVDLLTVRAPTLNIIDAYHPMVRNGPRGKSVEDCVEMKTLLASRDITAVDAAGAKLLGAKPVEITHVKLASEQGFGVMDLEQVDIRRLRLA